MATIPEPIPNAIMLKRPGLHGQEEKVGLKNIVWASHYVTRAGLRGVLILLNSAEFRFYVNKFEEVQLHYQMYIGRMVKARKKVNPLWDGE